MSDSATAGPLRRHVAAVVVGNALEFYDFLTYTFFAVYMGQAFFPSHNPTSSLLASLAAFGAGFVTRPIGGIVLGALGDRVGRRPAMFLSFSLMGTAIVGVALTPSYARIGIAAPILVIAFRLLQGFALGGEVGPSTAFLIEAAPPGRRGFYGSLQGASQYASTFAAGLAGSGLAFVLAPEALASWGWRVAFLFGALTVPFGLFIRASLPETLHAPAAARRTGGLIGDNLRVVICGLLMLASATIATYVILFLSTYAQATLHMAPLWAFGSTLTVGAVGTVFAALGGALSDRIGRRRPTMIATTVLLILITVPAFALLDHYRSGPVLLAVAAALTMVFTSGSSVIIMSIAESLPPAIRSAGASTIYAFAIAIFGGTTQFNVAWLTARTGDPIAPAYYMTAALLVGLAAMTLFRESAPARRGP